jgi:hypothetical protein
MRWRALVLALALTFGSTVVVEAKQTPAQKRAKAIKKSAKKAQKAAKKSKAYKQSKAAKVKPRKAPKRKA